MEQREVKGAERYIRDESTAEECLPYVVEAMRSVCDVISNMTEYDNRCKGKSRYSHIDLLVDGVRSITMTGEALKRYNDALDKICEISHFDKENDRFLLVLEQAAAAIATVNDYAEVFRR